MKTWKYAVLMLSVVALCGGCSWRRSNETTEDPKVLEEQVAYYTGANGPVDGYLVRPDDKAKHPGIILIHEWWGVNDNMHDYARKFAEQGYVALVVDLYDGESTTDPEKAMELAGKVRENMPEAFKNLQSALDTLRKRPEVDATNLASVGWCFGGGWAYEVAKNNLGVKASVMYYGATHPEDDLEQMKALILGHFGEKDANIKIDTAEAFQAKLQTLSGEHEVYIYPNAGHGFANEGNPNYDQKVADLAWERTLRFLKEHLGSGSNESNAGVTVGDFQWDRASGIWEGTVFVRGYPEIQKVKEPLCEGDCAEYDYVFFQLLQTTSADFKAFLEENAANASAKPEEQFRIGLGCVKNGEVSYKNDSDVYGSKEFILDPELSSAILGAKKETPIGLKLTKLKWSSGRDAPACYSHFTTVEKI